MKRWYLSKTFWINIVAIGAIIVRAEYGLILAPETEIVILAGINMLLRLITKEKIEWKNN